MKRAQILNHLILLAGVAFMILPIAVIFLSSTHATLTLQTEGMQLSWGDHFLENYARVISLEAGYTDDITALGMMKNSLIVGGGVAVLTTIFSLLTAYAIVFFRFRIANLVFWLVFVTLLFPLESRFLPTFSVTTELGLINTQLGIILPVLALALGTFFFRQYFLTIPNEYMEAATLDGAGPFRFLIDFILPLSWARAGAIFVISFMVGWNQYLWPLLISTDETHYTLVRGIRLIGQESGPGMALIMLSILPPFVVLLGFQRWFFNALVDSPNKG